MLFEIYVHRNHKITPLVKSVSQSIVQCVAINEMNMNTNEPRKIYTAVFALFN